ncbi:M20 family metallopeptidase [Dethiosulfovibrio salsuginis]|uniref:Peptidase M20 domain-containing protein 2 n=1 Tax=Dethiosulfovibrio salsuginis TaxID=561720 RepID=A0A1X7J6A0_9BACT|nr:M20 family metallopeptidase [Dethiosulfovibrio salsuginis]SMG23156.1 amidohydrolase [Dethiosulfovibrio salsuginis]
MISYDSLVEKMDRYILELSPKAIALSDYMAANPELGGQEFNSSRMMADFLREEGFSVEIPFLDIPTAYRGKVGEKGPIVALMAEYDALPGLGHACGHCLSGSMSLLAGSALARIADEAGGAIWVVGTPSEETDGAKVTMAASGLFDSVSLAMMIHANADTSLVRYRSMAMDALEFRFKGRAAHAAGSPWEGRNALNGVQVLFHALDMMRQHVPPDVRMHGIVTDGGDAPNIVPQTAAAKFYFRSPTRAYLNDMIQKVLDCAKGAAMATQTEVSWENVEFSFDEMVPNEPAESMMEGIFSEMGIPFERPGSPSGSSDVGNVSQRCPTLQPELAIMDHYAAHHTVEFAQAVTTEKAHRALVTGAKIMGRGAIKTWLDGDLRKSMGSVG